MHVQEEEGDDEQEARSDDGRQLSQKSGKAGISSQESGKAGISSQKSGKARMPPAQV